VDGFNLHNGLFTLLNPAIRYNAKAIIPELITNASRLINLNAALAVFQALSQTLAGIEQLNPLISNHVPPILDTLFVALQHFKTTNNYHVLSRHESLALHVGYIAIRLYQPKGEPFFFDDLMRALT